MSDDQSNAAGRPMAKPPFSLDETLARGGAERIALFQYCVRSITVEPLFLFTCSEYRLRASHPGALAIYDVFCGPSAPARIRAPQALPPRELCLAASIERVRARVNQSIDEREDEATLSGHMPARFDLFDRLSTALLAGLHGPLAELAKNYDPVLTPDQNLAGGRMNASQQYFRDRVWVPVIRPRLVKAGFWQLGAID